MARKKRGTSGKRYSDDQLNQMRSMFAANIPSPEIANRTGISIATINYHRYMSPAAKRKRKAGQAPGAAAAAAPTPRRGRRRGRRVGATASATSASGSGTTGARAIEALSQVMKMDLNRAELEMFAKLTKAVFGVG